MDGQKGKNVDIIIFKNAQILTELTAKYDLQINMAAEEHTG